MWGCILSVAMSAGHPDLVSLFTEWRAFQKPKVVNGVPDYTPAAMARQHGELEEYRRRLATLDSRGWPVWQQVDYQIVRAEMNGLDFDHRVLRPWAQRRNTSGADARGRPRRR
jgi:hypothetical protein